MQSAIGEGRWCCEVDELGSMFNAFVIVGRGHGVLRFELLARATSRVQTPGMISRSLMSCIDAGGSGSDAAEQIVDQVVGKRCVHRLVGKK
jgi:hypothetical protein